MIAQIGIPGNGAVEACQRRIGHGDGIRPALLANIEADRIVAVQPGIGLDIGGAILNRRDISDEVGCPRNADLSNIAGRCQRARCAKIDALVADRDIA
ncbi:MAG TPA: hypothetical protein VF897_00335 [Roseiflexaceae bacterium]